MRAGTKVFDIRFGWGVSYNRFSDIFPIGVNFVNKEAVYKPNGESGDGYKWLSLTKYSLEKGGFTAIDSEPPLVVGDMVYVWDNEENGRVSYGRIVNITRDGVFPFTIRNNGTWEYASKEIPQWFIEANK